MSSVYLVTSGAFAERAVDAAFSTRELAEAWIAAVESRSAAYGSDDGSLRMDMSEDFQIEEFPLDPPPAEFPDESNGAWCAVIKLGAPRDGHMITDGRLAVGTRRGYPRVTWRDGVTVKSGHVSTWPMHFGGDITITGYGHDRGGALRSAVDLEAALIAGAVVIPIADTAEPSRND